MFFVKDTDTNLCCYAAQHADRLNQLQQALFDQHQENEALQRFALGPISKIDTPDALTSALGNLSRDELASLCEAIFIRTKSLEGKPHSHEFLMAALVSVHERRESHIEAAAAMPLYPTEVRLLFAMREMLNFILECSLECRE